jgi:hypothetical protein
MCSSIADQDLVEYEPFWSDLDPDVKDGIRSRPFCAEKVYEYLNYMYVNFFYLINKVWM